MSLQAILFLHCVPIPFESPVSVWAPSGVSASEVLVGALYTEHREATTGWTITHQGELIQGPKLPPKQLAAMVNTFDHRPRVSPFTVLFHSLSDLWGSGEWIKKMWHIYTMEYYSAIKRNEIESFVVRWMDLESVIQGEVSQKEENKYCMLTHIYGI